MKGYKTYMNLIEIQAEKKNIEILLREIET